MDELVREGTRRMIQAAIDAEVETFNIAFVIEGRSFKDGIAGINYRLSQIPRTQQLTIALLN